MNSNKPRILDKNIDFFVAALSQSLVSVWQEDPAGVYCEIGVGYVEQFSDDTIRIRSEEGRLSYFARDNAMFQALVNSN
ncbi:hypothetical protein Q5741_11570 [Paenibacillus sp. JX-17]|uniref:Uncharacterized protein n=1 Tax=Paenibacillus lacisoli TaxID=3064525 RepID=A0ABT9CCR2_9BACL|nr:hypothetical protein [Paenibacillus sp. JX-17]MDO7907055.1 hypothetical protein [Paenibacillus sp. JX-17]